MGSLAHRGHGGTGPGSVPVPPRGSAGTRWDSWIRDDSCTHRGVGPPQALTLWSGVPGCTGAAGARGGQHGTALPGPVLLQEQAVRRGVPLRPALLRLQRRESPDRPTPASQRTGLNATSETS